MTNIMMNRKILIIAGTVILILLIIGIFLWQNFGNNTLIIIGDNASEIELQAANEITSYLENKTGDKPLIKKYSEITEKDKRNHNLVVVGTPNSNLMLIEVYSMVDVLEVNDTFPGEGKGVLEILRNPWNKNKVMLLVEGWDEWGVYSAGLELNPIALIKNETSVVIAPSIKDKIRIDVLVLTDEPSDPKYELSGEPPKVVTLYQLIGYNKSTRTFESIKEIVTAPLHQVGEDKYYGRIIVNKSFLSSNETYFVGYPTLNYIVNHSCAVINLNKSLNLVVIHDWGLKNVKVPCQAEGCSDGSMLVGGDNT